MTHPSRLKSVLRSNVAFWALVAFLVAAFLTGGGARADIQSLAILRPLSVFVCGFALYTMTAQQARENRLLLGMAAAIILLVVAHLIPLPPTLWESLPGRDIIVHADRAARIGAIWRPLSMVPRTSWNALYALFVPLAVLLLGIQLGREERLLLLPVVVSLGLMSGLWGLLQAIGDPAGPLYLYRITNNGSAVGLFSNRNHQAIFLAMLFPMLAVYACAGVRTEAQARIRGGIAVASSVVVVPLLLVTGSRAGLALGMVGLIVAALLYRRPQVGELSKRKLANFYWQYVLIGLSVLCLGALTALLSRAEALQRFSSPDPNQEERLLVWKPIAHMAWSYFPVGSGVGSFAEVYQIGEANRLLGPNYLNHAHNDWLELYMTVGLPGLVLLAIALFAFVRSVRRILASPIGLTRDSYFGRLGAVVIAFVALGSVVDYPLRTPSLSCVFVIAVLWVHAALGRLAKMAGSS